MNHVIFKKWKCLLIFFLLSTAEIHAAEKHPNVLMIVIDDLNDWVGCLGGHPQASTPNIDRLAARGVLFANAHCQAPLCNPSRTSVLTGLRPGATGVYGLEPTYQKVPALKDALTLPRCFAAAGYHTATSGKIFHESHGLKLELEFQDVGTSGHMKYPSKKLVQTEDPMKAVDWGPYEDDSTKHADWKIASAAIQQLQSRPRDKPFFIATGFRYPHLPCYAPPAVFKRFPVDITLPEIRRDDRNDIPFTAWYLHWKLPEPRLSWLEVHQQWRPLVRAYLASTTFMDEQLGRLLAALEADPQGKDTLIVLWSDHGWHLGEKGISGKNTLWERSTRVPMIIAGPGISSGVCREPVELLDIYPTLAALCGLTPPKNLQGHSLEPQLQKPATPRAWPAITTHNQGNNSVRSAQWRYIRYADGTQELYDHNSDPNEWTNLAMDKRCEQVIAEHRKWLPTVDAQLAPGSANRILEYQNGQWTWEGRTITAKIIPGEVPDKKGIPLN